DDLAARLADDEDAAARQGAQEPLLLEQGHRFADRRAADPERLRELTLVEADLVRMGIDIGGRDRFLDGVISLIAEARARVERLDVEFRRFDSHIDPCKLAGSSERVTPDRTVQQ